jgi:hypothetical protein
MKTFAYIVLALNIGIIPINYLAGSLTSSSLILNLSVSAIVIVNLFQLKIYDN